MVPGHHKKFPAFLAMFRRINAAVMLRQSLTLLALLTVGLAFGVALGGLLAYRNEKPRLE
jgi:hypothetical protein